MKKLTFLALLFCFLLPLTGCGGDSNIDLVKNASFRGYETTTIGKMLDGTFDKTKWTSEQNPKGEILVLFEGRIPQKMHDSLVDRAIRSQSMTETPEENPMYIGRKMTDMMGSFLYGAVSNEQIDAYNNTVNAAYLECMRKGYESEERSNAAWTNERNACGRNVIAKAKEILDEAYWPTGNTVFFEWKIHSDGKRFELSRFGGQSMPKLNLGQVLEIIYKQ